MTDRDEDLRATAEAIIADAERLKSIESVKATLNADDPRAEELAEESSRVAERITVEVQAQEELLREASEDGSPD
jgi:hypothetical protein